MAFKLLAGFASACALLCASVASAQGLGTVTSALPPASNVNPGDLLPCSQATGVTGHFASKGCTPFQIVTGAGGEMLSHKGAASGYAPLDNASHLPLSNLPALTGGDAYTASGSGAIILNTIASSPGAYPKITFNAKGQVTGGGPLASTDITAAGGALSSSLGTASAHAATDFDAAGAGQAAAAASVPLAGGTSTGAQRGVAPSYGDNSTTFPTSAWEAAQVPCKEIDRYGADPSGQVDSTSAWNAALAAARFTGRLCVRFGTGTYKFNGQIAVSMTGVNNAVTIEGQGPEATQISFPSNGGFSIALSDQTESFHVRDMTILAGAAGTGNPGLYVSQSQAGSGGSSSDITHVNIHGVDGDAKADYFTYGVEVYGVSQITYTDLNYFGSTTNPYGGGYAQLGTGVYIYGTASVIPVVHNFVSCNFTLMLAGISYGTYTQGVGVTVSNFTGGKYGIYSAAGLTQLDELIVQNSQFNDVFGIYTNTWIPSVELSGDAFYVPAFAGGTGIYLAQSGNFNIVGVDIAGNGSTTINTYGIVVSGAQTGTGGVIADSVCGGFSDGACIVLQTALSVKVASMVYLGNQTNVSDGGSKDTIEATHFGNAMTYATLTATDPTPVVGDSAVISDAPSCTFHAAVTAGGSSTVCPVVYSGSNWIGG